LLTSKLLLLTLWIFPVANVRQFVVVGVLAVELLVVVLALLQAASSAASIKTGNTENNLLIVFFLYTFIHITSASNSHPEATLMVYSKAKRSKNSQ
jgi:hypothetical protein